MLDFKEIKLTDRPLFQTYLTKKNYFMCEYCFTDIFIWRNHYNTVFDERDGFLFIKSSDGNGKDYYYPPIGEGDFAKAVAELKDYAEEHGQKFELMLLLPEDKEKLESAMPGYFDFFEDRDTGDYIYFAEKLMYLKGKKLHGKRNHINKFMLTYDNWSYEPLDDANSIF